MFRYVSAWCTRKVLRGQLKQRRCLSGKCSQMRSLHPALLPVTRAHSFAALLSSRGSSVRESLRKVSENDVSPDKGNAGASSC